MTNRLAIYFFYDKDGIVDDYAPHLLEKLKPFCRELCIVVNGNLTEEGKKKFAPYCDTLLVRPNTGFDAHAYKHALEHYGYDRLAQYDEVLLLNFTFFGPFFPLKNIFEKMDNTPCDWWALYKWPTTMPIKYNHLPSFWTAYRKSLVQSPDFRRYWDTLQPIFSYFDSCQYHEQRQTPYYDNLGYKSAVWLDQGDALWEPDHGPLLCADQAVIKDGIPFIKRRNFYVDKGVFVYPRVVLNLLNFLAKQNIYDLRMIYRNISRTQPRLELPRHTIRRPLYWLLSKIHPAASKRKHYIQKMDRAVLSPKINNLFPQLMKGVDK